MEWKYETKREEVKKVTREKGIEDLCTILENVGANTFLQFFGPTEGWVEFLLSESSYKEPGIGENQLFKFRIEGDFNDSDFFGIYTNKVTIRKKSWCAGEKGGIRLDLDGYLVGVVVGTRGTGTLKQIDFHESFEKNLASALATTDYIVYDNRR